MVFWLVFLGWKQGGDKKVGWEGSLGISEERMEAKHAGWGMMEPPVPRDSHGTNSYSSYSALVMGP